MAQTQTGRVVPNAQPVSWSNVTQQYTREVDSSGVAVTGYRVGFTTDQGVVGSIFVPAAQYTPTNVVAAIARHAAELNAIHASTSTQSAY